MDQDPRGATKIDPITAVQDSIDGLALSLFEALRGVRDAVAPESLEAPGAQRGATAAGAEGAAADETSGEGSTPRVVANKFLPGAFDLLEPDYDAFILACLNDDPYAKDLVAKCTSDSKVAAAAEQRGSKKQPPGSGVPRNEKAYIRLIVDSEKERDARVAQILARDVLSKSAAVDELVANLPGIGRTRAMQMERIEELIGQCRERAQELEDARTLAELRREEVRTALRETTCLALGVEEEGF